MSRWLLVAAGVVAAAGLTVVNVLQGGADPVTDAAEVADVSATAGEATTAGDSAGVDLQAAEDAGGHTIARHVGLSAGQLIGRNIPYASTFNDLSTAETATADNIAANESIISKWLSGTSSRLAIQNGMDSSGGTIYDRATQSFTSPSAVNTVLARTATG